MAKGETLTVELTWDGLHPIQHIDYTVQPDDFQRNLAKIVNEVSDINLDRKGLWFFASGNEDADGAVEIEDLLFIGVAFSQDLREEIPDKRHMRSYKSMLYECRNYDLYLAYAFISDTEGGKWPKRLESDIQCALIFDNQPLCNPYCRDEYKSKEGTSLTINNVGDFFPLEETSTVEA
jgi:hypothetical protein